MLIAPWLVVLGVLVWLRWRFLLVTIVGDSMRPTLEGGDRVIARRTARSRIRNGDVVVVRSEITLRTHGTGTADGAVVVPAWIVKRVAALPGDPVPPLGMAVGDAVVPAGSMVLLGDNREESHDSREAGYYPLARIRGKVVGPAGRRLPARPCSSGVDAEGPR